MTASHSTRGVIEDAESSESETRRADGAISVLCIDDDPQQVDLLGLYLERETATVDVTTATNAQEALSVAKRDQVDCVVSDFDMPRMNGIELLREIRRHQPGVPLVLHTSLERRSLPDEFESLARVEYRRKDFAAEHYEALADTVECLVGHATDR